MATGIVFDSKVIKVLKIIQHSACICVYTAHVYFKYCINKRAGVYYRVDIIGDELLLNFGAKFQR